MITELTHVVAVVVTLGAAFFAASTNLCIRKGTDEGKTADGFIVVLAVNLLVLVPLVAVVYYPAYRLTTTSWLSFVAAGIVGTLFGRLLNYTSIHRIGASRTAPIVASWVLLSTMLGIVVLGESLSPIHAVGVVLVVGGVATIAWETGHVNPDDLTRRGLLLSLLIPFAAAFAYGLEPIFVKFGVDEGTPAAVGLVIKTVAATLGFTLYLRWHDALPDAGIVRSAGFRWFVLAGVTNTLFILGYYLALEIAPVNVVAPLIVTNTLFVVLLSALVMPERLESVTWHLAVAAVVVVTGVALIAVYG